MDCWSHREPYRGLFHMVVDFEDLNGYMKMTILVVGNQLLSICKSRRQPKTTIAGHWQLWCQFWTQEGACSASRFRSSAEWVDRHKVGHAEESVVPGFGIWSADHYASTTGPLHCKIKQDYSCNLSALFSLRRNQNQNWSALVRLDKL